MEVVDFSLYFLFVWLLFCLVLVLVFNEKAGFLGSKCLVLNERIPDKLDPLMQ